MKLIHENTARHVYETQGPDALARLLDDMEASPTYRLQLRTVIDKLHLWQSLAAAAIGFREYQGRHWPQLCHERTKAEIAYKTPI